MINVDIIAYIILDIICIFFFLVYLADIKNKPDNSLSNIEKYLIKYRVIIFFIMVLFSPVFFVILINGIALFMIGGIIFLIYEVLK